MKWKKIILMIFIDLLGAACYAYLGVADGGWYWWIGMGLWLIIAVLDFLEW